MALTLFQKPIKSEIIRNPHKTWLALEIASQALRRQMILQKLDLQSSLQPKPKQFPATQGVPLQSEVAGRIGHDCINDHIFDEAR